MAAGNAVHNITLADRERLRRCRHSDFVKPSGSVTLVEQLQASKQITGGGNGEVRTQFQKDLDLILYSYYTRRLAQVTQVVSKANNGGISSSPQTPYAISHNRLTHSLKVGQVARRLAQYLCEDSSNMQGFTISGSVDFDVAELAGRAHDMGHPPFGHLGERVLNRLSRNWGLIDGFEGNAQTFRIVTFLHQKLRDGEKLKGMDLTMASAAALVKYPWGFDRQQKAGKYNYYIVDEASFQELVYPLLYHENMGTLEAQIMDWADDISYAAHDVEDYALRGLIPVHLLSVNSGSIKPDSEFSRFWDYAKRQLPPASVVIGQKVFTELADDFFLAPLDDSEASRATMSAFVSRVITKTSQDTSVSSRNGCLKKEERALALVSVLKSLTWYYVINRPDMRARQIREERVLKAVACELYRQASYAYNFKEGCGSSPLSGGRVCHNPECLLETPFREVLEHSIEQYYESGASNLPANDDERRGLGVARGVIDYVAGLTEEDIFHLYKIYGLGSE